MRARLRGAVLLLFLASPLVVLADEPRKDELAVRIRKATARAARALAVAQRPPEARTLVALALLRAGNHEDRQTARKILDQWWQQAWKTRVSNYELALAISALEGLSLERIEPGPEDTSTLTRYDALPLEPEIKKRLGIAVRALVDGRVGTDGEGCGWGYRTARFKDEEGNGKTKPKDAEREDEDDDLLVPSTSDNSNVQFSVLALHDAARAGVAIPDGVVQAVARHFLACKGTLPAKTATTVPPPGEEGTKPAPAAVRWGYRDAKLGHSASMSLAGLSSLAIVRELGARNDQLALAIETGLVRMSELVLACGRPDTGAQRSLPSGWGAPYNLYSLEKALDLLEVKEVDGKDWFAPLAESVLAAQGSDGLWQHDAIDSSLYVLFLTRATVSKARIEDHRTSSGGSSPAEVYIPAKKKIVDAVALLRGYAGATDVKASLAARADAGEALAALAAEGHGRDACLLGTLTELLAASSGKRETAQAWLKDLLGRDAKDQEVKAAAASARSLLDARETKKASLLRAAIADDSLALPLRAFAAHALSVLPCPEAAPDLATAAEKLADDRFLATGAGARCARAHGDALAALVRAKLPALPPKGAVSPEDLRALASGARDALKRALEDAVSHALAAHALREKDPAAWQRARDEVLAQGEPALRRLVALAEDKGRAVSAYSVLRAVTGELIPDDGESWKAYLDSKNRSEPRK
ncbi:hypothetical protein HY251_15630 [bacterium]|nr:hypothetical protein [bacterium]